MPVAITPIVRSSIARRRKSDAPPVRAAPVAGSVVGACVAAVPPPVPVARGAAVATRVVEAAVVPAAVDDAAYEGAAFVAAGAAAAALRTMLPQVT